LCWLQREQWALVSFDCQEELFRQDVQNADDIRLSIVLLRTCMADKQQFCAHVPYGAPVPVSLRLTSAAGHLLRRLRAQDIMSVRSGIRI
jgi:Golgi apparatus protein 1